VDHDALGMPTGMYKNDRMLYKDYDAHFMVMERPAIRRLMKCDTQSSALCQAGKLIRLGWKSTSGFVQKNRIPETFLHVRPSSISIGMR